MSKLHLKDPENRQWRTLLVYDIYRLLSIVLFLGIYFFNLIYRSNTLLFSSILLTYFIFSIVFLYFCYTRVISIEKQIFLSGTIDVIAVSCMLNIIGNLQAGYGILLNVTIAALSILAPGRLAIFFASLASCLLLSGSFFQFIINNTKDLSIFYYSGIYGAGFFATALTALYLSNRVRASEILAQHRSEELAAMQRINEYIVDRLHSGIIYVDEEHQIKIMNTAVRKFFTVHKNNTVTHLKQLSSILAKKFSNFLEQTRNKERLAQTIIEEPYLKVHFISTSVADKNEVLIILEDMTYIAQQAQQLKLAALGRFTASLAHELRNPLGAISHAVQLMGEESSLSSEDSHLKQLIIKNCDRMNGVIKNVLQLSRRQKAEPQIIEIGPFLEQFKLDFCHSNSCTMNIKLPKRKVLSVVFDRSQLEQILVILCENAMQHGQDEQGNVDILIDVKSSLYKTILSVCDNGPGVPSEHRDNIFEPFFTTLRKGTGMGLFIAKDLCEINKATLNLEKSEKGSCFTITLSSTDELLI